jgi:hypothetical protein
MPGMTAAAWGTHGKVLKHYVSHYGMWIKYYGGVGLVCPAAGLSSGLAETLGNDFIVSLGCGFKAFGTADSDAEQAGTFMHELGHNLNLAHGGPNKAVTGRTATDYNMNCKPNSLSVMSYARQMPNAVFTRSLWESGFNYGASGVQTALDYARTTAPPPVAGVSSISEGGPDENAGMAAANGRPYKFLYLRTNDQAVKLGDTSNPFDFSGSVGSVAGDLNNIGSVVAGCGPTAGQTLKSYNDWNEVDLVFLTTTNVDSQDGLYPGDEPNIRANTRELAPPFLQAVKEKAADTIEFIPPPKTDGSSVSNTGSTIPMKFRLKDIDGNFVRDAVVTFVAKKGSTTIVGSTPFVYDLATEKYQFDWVSPRAQAKGVWQILYLQNYLTANEILLQGPEAAAAGVQYSFTLTLK